MKNAIVLKQTSEESTIKGLQKSIQKKRHQLQLITEKTELLKMELEDIQEQYNARIGWLYIKDNKLDLEIIKYKTIADFVATGLTYEEAIKEVENSYYNELLNFETHEEIAFGEQVFNEIKNKSQKADDNIKKLWKKLIVKFHPDLVMDKNEKQKREELIKKINKAYREDDLEALKILESHIYFEDIPETKIPELEKQLVSIENAIIQVTMQFKLLKNSQWFQWKTRLKKAKVENKDIFAEMERALLDDIGRKIDVLHTIKAKLNISSSQTTI